MNLPVFTTPESVTWNDTVTSESADTPALDANRFAARVAVPPKATFVVHFEPSTGGLIVVNTSAIVVSGDTDTT